MMVVAIFLSGCTTLSKNVQLVSASTTQSEIVIYRASAFQAGAVSTYLGGKTCILLSYKIINTINS